MNFTSLHYMKMASNHVNDQFIASRYHILSLFIILHKTIVISY